MFEDFDEFDIAVAGTTIHGRCGGSGPPLLLLHGFPETHLMWHRVAPALAEQFTVVATDLRGYGDSGKPPSTDDHAPYAMREIAGEQVEVMAMLGYEQFGVAGHDRGARCAYRMALDHPAAVRRLAVLDIVPTGDDFRMAGKEFALGKWNEPLNVWRRWADDVRGRAVDSGHFLPEEAPAEVIEELRTFFG